jgi:8-oxo-dGTP pyrophosphatase MutT (NUDIX family)
MSAKQPSQDGERASSDARLTHAGGIVTRDTPKGVRYLLVRARRDPMQWVLPKGHIDPGETAEQAALREVREEAGIEAMIVTFVGTSAYDLAREHCRVGFYLMRFAREVPAEEERGIAWMSLESALVSTPFADIRELLLRANSMRASGSV